MDKESWCKEGRVRPHTIDPLREVHWSLWRRDDGRGSGAAVVQGREECVDGMGGTNERGDSEVRPRRGTKLEKKAGKTKVAAKMGVA